MRSAKGIYPQRTVPADSCPYFWPSEWAFPFLNVSAGLSYLPHQNHIRLIVNKMEGRFALVYFWFIFISVFPCTKAEKAVTLQRKN